MSRIKVEHFGPIKSGIGKDSWVDIKKVTAFVGNQGSGKSTVAKLISTFLWIEKSLVRGDFAKEWLESQNAIEKKFLKYHRLENYLQPNTNIEFEGEAFRISFSRQGTSVAETGSNYSLPQIIYTPAERNFIAFVKSTKEIKLTSEPLRDFLAEYENALNYHLNQPLELPINEVSIELDPMDEHVNLKGKDFSVKLHEASSGFQSLTPMFLVARYLSHTVKEQAGEKNAPIPMSLEEQERFRKGVQEIWNNPSLTDEQKRVAISVLSSKFNKTAFIHIVEEPEQNLFPSSQWRMLQSLLESNNMTDRNRLVITTHSPYIINYLSILIQANILMHKAEKLNMEKVKFELAKIVNIKALVSAEDVAIYQLNEAEGSIEKLPMISGIPSDENMLNRSLAEGNQLFDALLEIEQSMLQV